MEAKCRRGWTRPRTRGAVLDAAGKVVGIIALDQIRRVLNERLPPQVLIVRDLMVENFPRVAPETDLAAALRLFAGLDVDEIVVWDSLRQAPAGLLSRKQITRAYVERMAALDVPG